MWGILILLVPKRVCSILEKELDGGANDVKVPHIETV